MSTDPFDALGDGRRRQILRLLAGADRSVAELADWRAARANGT